MVHLLLIAALNLRLHWRRSLLVGSALAGAVALTLLALGISSGIRGQLFQSATSITSGHVNVEGYYKINPWGRAAPVISDADAIEAEVRAAIGPDVAISRRVVGNASVASRTATLPEWTVVQGVELAKEPWLADALTLRAGNLADLAEPDAILLFERQATKLGVVPGDVLTLFTITQRGARNTAEVRVVAIAADAPVGATSVFVSAPAVRGLFRYAEKTTGVLQLRLGSGASEERVQSLQEATRAALEKSGANLVDREPQSLDANLEAAAREPWVGGRLLISNWEDHSEGLTTWLTAFGVLAVLVGLILFTITSAGIMNVLWLAVKARTREVGTLRALGLSRFRVVFLFLCEGGLMAGAASLVGIGAAQLVALVLSQTGFSPLDSLVPGASAMPVTLSVSLTFTVVLLSVGFGVLFSFPPSFAAARVRPVTAMQDLGA